MSLIPKFTQCLINKSPLIVKYGLSIFLDREPDGCFECILRCAECYPCADTHQLYTDSEALISWNLISDFLLLHERGRPKDVQLTL